MISRFSHSILKSYEQCPLLCYYRHVLKIELPTTSPHLHFGKSLHKALELYHTEKTDPLKTFEEEFKPNKLKEKDYETFFDLRFNGIEMLKQYQEKDLPFEIIRSEEKITLSSSKIAFDEITGIIDFETSDGRIGDYKTSSKPYSDQDIKESLQPTIYYYLKKLQTGEYPKSFIYVVFVKKRKRDKIQILETTRTEEDITNMIEKVNKLHSKLKNNEFERKHSEFESCECQEYTNLLRL